MKVLLTGADGYIGTVMADDLVRHGHDVIGLDTGFYRTGWLYGGALRRPAIVTGDTRDVTAADLLGFDAVVHLAELSNDPLGQLNPDVTRRINHAGSVHLATMAKKAGVARFVYMSSCSVYGVGTDGFVTEESPVNPQTAYAECKVAVEADVRGMTDDRFHPTCLRNATAFGASPRMRFDIVLNNLMGVAWTTREIRMSSDGTPWRPLVHILDTSAAVRAVLDAPAEVVSGEIFNVGSAEQNYQVRDIAKIVAEVVPDCSTSFGPPSSDNRSYRVAFDKIERTLPGFRCVWNAERGARQLADVFERVGLDDALFRDRAHTRLAQLTHLLTTGQLDSDLRWSAVGQPPAVRKGSAT
jgi:nucleoside-diphosphate-sugar epimerase